VAGKPTVNRYLALVRAILLRSRDEWEWIDKVPKVKLFKEGPGRERSITTEQAEALLRKLPGHQRDVVLFALATGLRQSNVLGLEGLMSTWTLLMLGGASQSKNRKPIAVPLNEPAVSVFAATTRKAPGEGVYVCREAAGLGQHACVEKALQRAGIENFRWRDLRHT
jgi:integrase